jgi:RNA polymerase sigma-70 factor (ECF subfamily)
MPMAINDDDDREYMSQLYIDFYRKMYKAAYRVLRNKDSIDDVINEACVSLIGKISVMRQMERYALERYIVITIRNTSLSHAITNNRRNKHTFNDGDKRVELLPADEDIEASIIYGEQVSEMKRALLMLSERDREALTLKYIDELSNAEIGLRLDIKPDSVRSALMRARRHAAKTMNRGEQVE